MKITVVGLGAVGGLMAAHLEQAGNEVSAVARGATLEAVHRHGLRLCTAGGETNVRLPVTPDPRTLGEQELVVIALKGPALAACAAQLAPLIGARTLALPAMNGVPWWFLQTGFADAAPASLASIDPAGRIAAALPLDRTLGCVVHLTSSCPQPGVVKHGFGDRLIVGEPAGGVSARVQRLARLLAEAGFKAEASEDIRRDIWFKLWGNMTMNPVSALTGATCDRILDDPLVSAFMVRAMAEAAEVGARIGCPIAQSGEERQAVARKLGAFKTSMLQDLEAGRALELDALVTVVREIAQGLGVATPNIDALLGLTRLMGATRGIYRAVG
jgi:2-dehydropantoate 2-reductase